MYLTEQNGDICNQTYDISLQSETVIVFHNLLLFEGRLVSKPLGAPNFQAHVDGAVLGLGIPNSFQFCCPPRAFWLWHSFWQHIWFLIYRPLWLDTCIFAVRDHCQCRKNGILESHPYLLIFLVKLHIFWFLSMFHAVQASSWPVLHAKRHF